MHQIYNKYKIWDFAQIHSATPQIICKPKTTKEIIDVIKEYPDHKISVAGGKYSHGGQTLMDNSIYIDFADFNKIIKFDENNQLITVQAGTTWEQIIHYLDKYDMSVSEMQSYCNFSVGGSISVNCHGRGLLYGTVGDSVESMIVLTTTGRFIFTNRDHHPYLFKAIIGGYGGIAIIISITLRVTENFPIKREIIITPVSQIGKFYKNIKKQKDLVFYNGNIYPKNENEIVNICWYKANQHEILTCTDRLQKKQNVYVGQMVMEQILRRNDAFKYFRAQAEPLMLSKKSVVYKNYEMTYDVNALQPLVKFPTTNILQEYFVPVNSIGNFLEYFWTIINYYKVNLLNVSLRYVIKTDIPILNYAPDDRIAVVLYLNIGNNTYCIDYAKTWTQLIIQRSIDLGGSYYLPYLPLATKLQFQLAYPNYSLYMKIKKKYDPHNRLCNQFIENYLN